MAPGKAYSQYLLSLLLSRASPLFPSVYELTSCSTSLIICSLLILSSPVVGIGMTKFDKPRGERDYPELGLEAAVKALTDAGITYDQVETASVGYVCE